MIARVSETHVTLVIVTWATMLESASQNEAQRGTLSGWEPEDIAALLGAETFEIEAIYQAMQGRVLDGNRLTAWDKRNPKREREDNSTERVQRHRAKQNTTKPDGTPGNTSNAKKHLDKRRVDKKREEGNKQGDKPPAEKRGGRADEAGDLFAAAYQTHIGSPYGFAPPDFVQLAALRKRLRISTTATPPDWNPAITNMFASPLGKFSLKHLAADYDTFKNSPLDRYGTPVNHANSGANGNGRPKGKDDINSENAQRLIDRLDRQDREREQRDADGGDAGGLSGAASGPAG